MPIVGVYVGEHVDFQASPFFAIAFGMATHTFHHVRKQRYRGGIEGIKLLETDFLFLSADRQKRMKMTDQLEIIQPEKFVVAPAKSVAKDAFGGCTIHSQITQFSRRCPHPVTNFSG
jgi:hypothetical protein